MFNLGFSELLLLGAIALIFIGPQQLPEMARTLGRLLNELKRASSDFQQSFTEPMKDDFLQRIEQARQENVDQPSQPPPTAEGAEAVTEPEPKLPRGDGQHES